MLVAILLAATAHAQLCGPSKSKPKGPAIEFTSLAIAVDLGGGLETLVEGEFVTDSVLIPQIVYTYPSFTTPEKMIESIRVAVNRYRAGVPSLVGTSKPVEEDTIYTLTFVPLDKEMVHFRGALDISTQGWDRISIKALPGSAKIINKADYTSYLIRPKEN